MQGGTSPLPCGAKTMVVSAKLQQHYLHLKSQVPDAVLLMQVGAFMQVMNEDAKIVSKICGIKLQMAGDIDNPVILGGFPKSGLDKYCGLLLRSGKSIAIAEQNEQKERHINEVIKVDILKNGTI